MDLWACRGPSRITSIKSVPTETLALPFEQMLLVPDRNTGPALRANHDTETAASPNCILFARPLTSPACSHVRTKIRLHSTTDRNCSTTIHNKLNHCDGPRTINIPNVFSKKRVRITRSCHCPRHLKLKAIRQYLWPQHVALCPPSCLFLRGVMP